MQLAMVGLGRMGANMTRRLMRGGHLRRQVPRAGRGDDARARPGITAAAADALRQYCVGVSAAGGDRASTIYRHHRTRAARTAAQLRGPNGASNQDTEFDRQSLFQARARMGRCSARRPRDPCHHHCE